METTSILIAKPGVIRDITSMEFIQKHMKERLPACSLEVYFCLLVLMVINFGLLENQTVGITMTEKPLHFW